MQDELNLVWEHLLPAFHAEVLPPDEGSAEALQERLANLALPFPEGVDEVFHAIDVTGKSFRYENNEQGIESLQFHFSMDKICDIVLEKNGNRYPLHFGEEVWLIQETAKPGPNLLNSALNHFEVLQNEKVAGTYAWQVNNTLELVLRYIESPHHEEYRITFGDEKISLEIRSSLPTQDTPATLQGVLVTE